MQYSTTQATNIASFVGIIVLILNHFKVNIGSDELTAVIGGILSAGGVIMNWIHRYKKGDITLGGSFKYPKD